MKLADFSIPGGTFPDNTSVPIAFPSEIPHALRFGLDVSGARLIQTGFLLLFYVGMVIAVVVMIFSGVQWMMSKGDVAVIASVKRRMIFATVGLILILLSYFIVLIVVRSLGVEPDTFLNSNP